MFYSTEWLVKAVVGRIEAYSKEYGVPAAGRIYWETLRTLRPMVEDEPVLKVRVDKWLRAFNFSDASYKPGPKLENDELLGLEMGVLFYDPDLGEWLTEEDPDEVDEPLPLLSELDAGLVRDHGKGPYEDDALNAEFWEAQRGGYPMVGSADGRYDDHDTREPEGWAEYYELEGLHDWIADLRSKWNVLPTADEMFDLAVDAHKAGEITVVDLAVLAIELNVEDLDVQVYSLVDGLPIGSLKSFMDLYQGELADVELDLPETEWSPRFAWEEQGVADTFARVFERELLEHWKADPGTYLDFRTQQEKPRKWSDAHYDLGYIRAIANGESTEEAKWHARRAKARAEGRTISRTVRGVTWKGLKMTNGEFLRWESLNQSRVKTLRARDQGKVVAQLREAWKRLVAHRPIIEVLGKAMA